MAYWPLWGIQVLKFFSNHCNDTPKLLQFIIKDAAVEWRILGQERNGSLLSTWVSKSKDGQCSTSHIGIYNAMEKTFDILHTFPKRENIIQASVNHSRTLLVYVTKSLPIPSSSDADDGQSTAFYKPFIVEINNDNAAAPKSLLEMERHKQVMVQFLWRKPTTFEKTYQDKFILLIHEESKITYILNYQNPLNSNNFIFSNSTLYNNTPKALQ